MADQIWLNGTLIDAASATLSAFDHGVTVGDGIFESLKVVRRPDGGLVAFALGRHLTRLRRSAAGLGLNLPATDEALRRAVDEVLAANPDSAQRVRITVTGGVGPLGSDRSGGAPTVIVATAPQKPWPPTTAIATVPWRRNEHSPVAGLKTTSYAENVVALQYAQERGASEAILANTAGNLCEGTGSNIFIGLDGRLVTPPLSSGCLAGVTRALLVEIVDVDEIDVPIERLGEATEAFLTSSTRDVQPVSAIDGQSLPACPGPLTAAAAEAFAALEARDIDP